MTTRFASHLLTGDHASRPAATAVPEGTLYSCTTHSLIYQSDGATWATYATLGSTETLGATIIDAKGDLIGGTAADTAARLAVGSNDQVLTADSAETTGLKWATSAAGAVVLIQDLVAGSPSASFDFTSIAGTYKHLLIVTVLRGTTAATALAAGIRLNNDSGSGAYLYQQMYGSGTATPSDSETTSATTMNLLTAVGSTAPTNQSAVGLLLIPNYTGGFLKSVLGLDYNRRTTGSGQQFVSFVAGTWIAGGSTSAVTRVMVLPSSGNFDTGSRATLYGL